MAVTVIARGGRAAPTPRSAERRHRDAAFAAAGYAALLVVGLLLVMPLLWMILSSLKAPEKVLSLAWVPEQVDFRNYLDIVQRGYLYNFGVSLFISGSASLGSVLSASLVGFGFARLRFAGRDFLFTLVLATMMLPAAVTLVPTFILFQRIGWFDTLLPLIVPSWLGAGAYGGGALYIFLMRQFYLTLPLEMDEAARIDGANALRIYWHIILPLSLPALGVVAAFAFIANWNDFLYPLIFVQSQALWPLALAVRALMGEFQHGSPWGSLMAASVLMVAPVGLVLFLSQRSFMRGIATTGLGWPVNVDLIGCGGFGEQLALYVRDVDEMTLRATYDPNPAAAARVAARFGATPYADLATLLRTSGSDAVLVATPHHTHHDVALQALEAGRHVFCEKPMARTVDECYDMLEAAERLGLRLTVGHKRRLRPTHAYVAEIAHSGALGRPITGNVQGYHWQVYDQRTQWWGRAAEVGGLLHWAGVHDFDTLRFIIGEVASVFAMAGPKLRADTDYSDSLSVLLRFTNGAVVTLESSPYYPLATYRRAFSYQFVYERGGIWYDPTRMTVEHQVEGGPRVVRTFDEWGFELAFSSELRSFARWAMHGERPLLTGEDGLRCVEIIQAAYISAAEGRLVQLPLERHEARGV